MRKSGVLLMALLVCTASVVRAVPIKPLTVCLVSGSTEYKSDESLSAFKDYLEKNYDVKVALIKAVGEKDLPGIEALDACDVALFFTRRLNTDGAALECVKKYMTSGKPVVALRTASHGFQNWLDADKLVFGGNYGNHFKAGVAFTAKVNPAAKDHPVLKGLGPITTTGSLYRNEPINPDATVLLRGQTPESKIAHPVAWVRTANGGRVFYTSLGTPEDFRNPEFLKLVTNALFWTAGGETPAGKTPPPQSKEPPRGPSVMPPARY
jgi:type 1 glutamine amidotransferase